MSVACPSTAFCVTVDNNGRAFQLNGHVWSGPRRVIEPGIGGLISVSCGRPRHCVAVSDTDAARLDGRRWTRPDMVDPGQAMSSISCPTTSFCAAVGDFGEGLTYSGRP
jgi:hypothetical protein